jgi:hypothetical protein
MRHKRMVALIGVQLPFWFRVERIKSVVADGTMTWTQTGKWIEDEVIKMKDAR